MIFVSIFVLFMFNFVSRPGRLLFSLVVKGSNNNKKKRQGKATQEKTQDQTSPREDQTDIPHLQQRGRVPKRNHDVFWRLSEFLRWNRFQNWKKSTRGFRSCSAIWKVKGQIRGTFRLALPLQVYKGGESERGEMVTVCTKGPLSFWTLSWFQNRCSKN